VTLEQGLCLLAPALPNLGMIILVIVQELRKERNRESKA